MERRFIFFVCLVHCMKINFFLVCLGWGLPYSLCTYGGTHWVRWACCFFACWIHRVAYLPNMSWWEFVLKNNDFQFEWFRYLLLLLNIRVWNLTLAERLDPDTSGILSTLCDHSFQCSCTSKWTYLSCQVSGPPCFIWYIFDHCGVKWILTHPVRYKYLGTCSNTCSFSSCRFVDCVNNKMI